MAYVGTDQTEQNPQGQQPQPVTSGGGAPAGVSKTPTSNVSNNVVGTNAPAQPFQNISTYLAANAPQVAQESQSVAGGLNQKATDIGTATKTAQSQFENQVQGATKSFTPEQAKSLEEKPFEFAANPSDVATFKSLYNVVTPYTGPTDFTTTPAYADLATKSAGAANLGTSLKDFGGLQAYLQSLNPQATTGTSTLDTALLEGSPEAMGNINAAAGTLKTQPANLSAVNEFENNLATTAQGQTQTAADTANQAAKVAQANFKNTLNPANQGADKLNSPYGNDAFVAFQSGTASPDQLAFLGVNPADYTAAVAGGVDPNKLLAAFPQVTNQIATKTSSPQDLATLQALQSLFQ